MPRNPGHMRGVSAACGGRRGHSPGEGATSSPTPIRISTAHRWSREGEGGSRGQELAQGGDLHPQPPAGLRSEERCPPRELKVPWAETLPRKLTKLCFLNRPLTGPGK